MKKQNKKLFLRFLKNRGIDTMFKGLYRQYRFPNNPEDFEQFLNAVDSYYVIQEAFDFNRIKASSDFDGHYWSQLQKQWNILPCICECFPHIIIHEYFHDRYKKDAHT